MNKPGQHQNGEGQEMQPLESIRQTFIVTGQPAKASHPAKGALNDPAAGQQDKAALGVGQFDDLKLDALLSGSVGRLVAGIALVNKGHFDALTSNHLNLVSELR